MFTRISTKTKRNELVRELYCLKFFVVWAILFNLKERFFNRLSAFLWEWTVNLYLPTSFIFIWVDQSSFRHLSKTFNLIFRYVDDVLFNLTNKLFGLDSINISTELKNKETWLPPLPFQTYTSYQNIWWTRRFYKFPPSDQQHNNVNCIKLCDIHFGI